MKKKKILEKIQSKFHLKNIFNYIKDKNFKFKLFTYSKVFQKHLEIHLIDYQEKYINQLGIIFNDYLTTYNEKEDFDKDILKKKLNEDLLKYNVHFDNNTLQKIVIKNFRQKIKDFEKQKSDEGLVKYNSFIDIYSPFFDSIANSDIFDSFTIRIIINKIEKYNLKDDYISIFEKMNKLKNNYSSIAFFYKDSNNIKYLKEFKINFGNIKKLSIMQKYNSFIMNYDIFFNGLFSFNNIGNNLIDLNINIDNNRNNIEIEPQLLEIINNFKSLKKMSLSGFKFKNNFNLRLNNIEKLFLNFCHNISFLNENNYINLRCLSLSNNYNIKSKYPLKLPELKICNLENRNNIEFNLIIDLSSLKNVKQLKCSIYDFLLIKNHLLEKISLYSNNEITQEEEIKMIEKILSIKTLKYIEFDLYKYDINEISNIQDENTSVLDGRIKCKDQNKDLSLFNLKKKLPNLSNLFISIYDLFRMME